MYLPQSCSAPPKEYPPLPARPTLTPRAPRQSTNTRLTNILLASILFCVAMPYVAIWLSDWQRDRAIQARLDALRAEDEWRAAIKAGTVKRSEARIKPSTN